MLCERVTPLVLPPAPKGAFDLAFTASLKRFPDTKPELSATPLDSLSRSVFVLLLVRTAFGGGAAALQPAEKFLLSRKHVATLVAQLPQDLITRLCEPRHAIC